MRSVSRMFLVTVVAGLFTGCPFSRPAPPTSPSSAPGTTQTAMQPDSAAADNSTANGSSDGAPAISAAVGEPIRQPNDKPDDRAADPSGGDSNAERRPDAERLAGEASTDPSRPAERFLLFAPQRPLVVELFVRLSGRDLEPQFQAYLESSLKALDSNSDGRTSWEELTRHPSFSKGAFSAQPITTEKRRLDLIEQNDIDRDKWVSLQEFARLLSREAANSRMVTLRSPNDGGTGTVRDSIVFQLLDQNGDGQLSGSELDQASLRLLSKDLDDDELVALADLRAESATLTPNAPMARPRVWSAETAVSLGWHVDWDRVFADMQETYALGGSLSRDCFENADAFFDELDADNNGRITRRELERLLTVAADLRVEIDFHATQASPPAMEIVSRDATLTPSPSMGKGIVTLCTVQLPHLATRWFCADRSVADDSQTRAEQALAQYDSNNDGYLEEAELPDEPPQVKEQFQAADENGDGKIYPGEIADYFRRQRGIASFQLRIRLGYQPDVVFAELDSNANGRLDFREIQVAGERLAGCDRNQDGRLSADEFQRVLLVSITRGDTGPASAELDATPLVMPPQPASDVAPWFRNMDSNGDGAISRREFLGDAERFRELDANADGFLDWSELQQLSG